MKIERLYAIHMDESNEASCNYDIIIGENIMHYYASACCLTQQRSHGNKAKFHMQSPEVLRGDWIDTTDAKSIQRIENIYICRST